MQQRRVDHHRVAGRRRHHLLPLLGALRTARADHAAAAMRAGDYAQLAVLRPLLQVGEHVDGVRRQVVVGPPRQRPHVAVPGMHLVRLALADRRRDGDLQAVEADGRPHQLLQEVEHLRRHQRGHEQVRVFLQQTAQHGARLADAAAALILAQLAPVVIHEHRPPALDPRRVEAAEHGVAIAPELGDPLCQRRTFDRILHHILSLRLNSVAGADKAVARSCPRPAIPAARSATAAALTALERRRIPAGAAAPRSRIAEMLVRR